MPIKCDNTDLQILFLKKQRERLESEAHFVNGAAVIQDEYYSFRPVKLIDDRVQIKLPSDFSELPKHLIAARYPASNRPSIVLSSNSRKEYFVFSRASSERKSCSEAADAIQKAMRACAPQNVIYECGALDAENVRIHWLEYRSFTLRDCLYNVLFLFGLDEELVIGSFQCAFKEFLEWKAYAFLMIGSIQLLEA